MKHRTTIRVLTSNAQHKREFERAVEGLIASNSLVLGARVEPPVRIRGGESALAELFAPFDDARALGGRGGRR